MVRLLWKEVFNASTRLMGGRSRHGWGVEWGGVGVDRGLGGWGRVSNLNSIVIRYPVFL